MSKKMNVLLLSNIIFYIFIMLNIFITKRYGPDYILQAIIYISLSISTIVLEEAFSKNIKKIRLKAVIDFGIRIAILILHLISLAFNANILFMVIVIAICLLINTIIEVTLRNGLYDVKIEEKELVGQKEINDFIQLFFKNQLDNSKLQYTELKELKKVINNMKISGMQNMVAGVLIVAVFASRLTLKYSINMFYAVLLLMSFFIYTFIMLDCKLIDSIYENIDKNAKKKMFINFAFITGYIILFLCEVIFVDKIELFRVSLWALSIISFTPILKIKFKEREKLIKIYIGYKK